MDRDTLLSTAGETIAFAEDYLETRIELAKLSIAKKGATSAASALTFVVLTTLGLFALASFSIALALFLGTKMGAPAFGFAAVGGLYLILAIVLFLFRNPLLTHPILQKVIKSLFKENRSNGN